MASMAFEGLYGLYGLGMPLMAFECLGVPCLLPTATDRCSLSLAR